VITVSKQKQKITMSLPKESKAVKYLKELFMLGWDYKLLPFCSSCCITIFTKTEKNIVITYEKMH
jgi:hypothetical protein